MPRKIRYESMHPDAVFIPPRVHEPAWCAQFGNGNFEMKATSLGELLNRLEQLDGSAVPV